MATFWKRAAHSVNHIINVLFVLCLLVFFFLFWFRDHQFLVIAMANLHRSLKHSNIKIACRQNVEIHTHQNFSHNGTQTISTDCLHDKDCTSQLILTRVFASYSMDLWLRIQSLVLLMPSLIRHCKGHMLICLFCHAI